MRRLSVIVPAVTFLGLLVLLFLTRGAMEQMASLRRGTGSEAGLVDQRPYLTAHTLAQLADSAEEQRLAQEAERLADHEVDQAFAFALRQSGLRVRTLTGDAAATARRVAELKVLVREDKARSDELDAAAKLSAVPPSEGDEADLARAQLSLDTDELTDATQDLARQSGDDRGRIQAELTAREAAMKKIEAQPAPVIIPTTQQSEALWQRANAWFEQRHRARLIARAREQAEADVKEFGQQHAELEGTSATQQQAAGGTAGGQVVSGSARVQVLRTLGERRVMMSILDDRAQTEQQLAIVYSRWEKQVWLQHRVVSHLVFGLLAWIAFLVLAASLLVVFSNAVVRRRVTNQRRARTLGTILTLGIEGVALLGVLLILFGVPRQTPTILGLATAGLTVVFQDFILAFFGWFVLMGRGGIRVCDWVEINGVGGEVAEIGLMRTALLETGNWTSRGHPTGRRVTFINSFAIRGQYFNFSTHGQWMWDEIKLNIPATMDATEITRKMQEAVEQETANDTEQAEREWQGVTRQNGLRVFTAKPTVDLRPAASGMDVLVRFITRASGRFELRRKLYETLVGLLQDAERASQAAAAKSNHEAELDTEKTVKAEGEVFAEGSPSYKA